MASAAIAQSKSSEYRVLLATVLASGMAFIDATALNVALPAIQSEMRALGTQLLWIVNAYALVTASLIFFGGALGDRYGRRRVFSIGIGTFVIASMCCGAAWDVSSLIAARAFQGFGAALMIPGSLAVLSSTFDASRRGRAIGVWSACSVVMTALGPIIGGVLAEHDLWRGIFLINLPIGIVSLVVLGKMKSETEHEQRRDSLDYQGAVWTVVGLAALNLGLLGVVERGWNDPLVVTALLVSFVAAVAFVWTELVSPCPLLPLQLFRERSFAAASQLTIFFYSALYGMLFFLSLNLIQVQGYRASLAGLSQLPVMLLVILLSPVAGILMDRHGPRLPLTVGGIFGSIGFLWLSRIGLTGGPSEYATQFLPPLVIIGIAMGMTAAPLSTTIINSVPSRDVGIASGVNSTLSRLSGVLGLAVLGPIAITVFSRSLSKRTATLSIGDDASTALRHEYDRLADAIPPPGLSMEVTEAVEHSIRLAYVDAFRTVSWMSAVAIGLSTVLATALLTRRSAEV